MVFELLQEMDNLIKEAEKSETKAVPKVAKTLAQKVYRRDYLKTRKKKYRVDQD
jgi:hypothetical protein